MQEQGAQLSVCIGAAQGEFPEQVASRQIRLVLHQACPARQVRLNHQPVSGWKYNPEFQELTVDLFYLTSQDTFLEIQM